MIKLKFLTFAIAGQFVISCTHIPKIPKDLHGKENWTKDPPAHLSNAQYIKDKNSWTCQGYRGRQETGGARYLAKLDVSLDNTSTLSIGDSTTRKLVYLGHSKKRPSHQAWAEKSEDGVPVRVVVYSGSKNSRTLRSQVEFFSDEGIKTSTVRNIECKPN
jgi:hypothetical protein